MLPSMSNTSRNTKNIGVIGAGAWGTALAQMLSNGGRDVLIWAREPEVAETINTRHENTLFLPSIELSETLTATEDLNAAARSDVLLLVTPAQRLRTTLETIRADITPETILVLCSKGIELDTGLLLSEVCEQTIPKNKIAVLTGPTFAAEIAAGLPAAATIGVQDTETGKILQNLLGVKGFRPYVSEDIIGVQLGGALKNVIAIACGVVFGRQLGESARAALLTRGVAEIARLGKAMGAKEETLMGMCGMGDLMLTASSMQSRNFSLGAALGEGKSMDSILSQRNAVTEGVHTARSTLALAEKYDVDMPITMAVYQCLHERMPVDEAIEAMLNRPFK